MRQKFRAKGEVRVEDAVQQYATQKQAAVEQKEGTP